MIQEKHLKIIELCGDGCKDSKNLSVYQWGVQGGGKTEEAGPLTVMGHQIIREG